MRSGRFFRSADSRGDSSEQLFPVLASETARSSSMSSHQPPALPAKNNDEKISLFWRVFGGTILSISALVVISAYQGLSNGIHDLRTDLAKANEARGDFVKKDEFATSKTKIWDHFQEMQKESAVVTAPIDPMKLRIDKLEIEYRNFETERREMTELRGTFKERLSQIELQLAQSKLTQKEVQALQQSVQGLQDKIAFREQQLKQSEDERKELNKELQGLRERLAKVEVTKESRPGAAKPTGKHAPDDEIPNEK
jgi:hypothetical protein